MATGWFGRGGAGSISAKIYADSNARFLSRPARQQKEFIDPKNYHLEGAQEYNIWYGKYMTNSYENGASKEKASDRCVTETDAGFTRADGVLVKTSKKEKHFFCLHFARGMCAKGAECKFYHRIPTPEDDAGCDELFDCFGRPRHNKHKDDMSGTGSFMKPCRTLFVGSLLKHKYETNKDLEDCLWRHFSEWGELESINVIYRLSICFPRYRLRTSAGRLSSFHLLITLFFTLFLFLEFAKEAMSNHSLDQGEILMVRWAHDDPNPIAQDSIERADKDALAALMRAKGIRVDAAAFEYPAGYDLPEAKRLKLEDGSTVAAALEYPNTDAQYGDSEGVPQAGWSEEQYAKYYQQYYGVNIPASSSADSQEAHQAEPSESTAQEESVSEPAGTTAKDEWVAHTDDDTGAIYYYNESKGESTWTRPDVV